MLVNLLLKFAKVVVRVQNFGKALETCQQTCAIRSADDLFKLLVLLSGFFLRTESRYSFS